MACGTSYFKWLVGFPDDWQLISTSQILRAASPALLLHSEILHVKSHFRWLLFHWKALRGTWETIRDGSPTCTKELHLCWEMNTQLHAHLYNRNDLLYYNQVPEPNISHNITRRNQGLEKTGSIQRNRVCSKHILYNLSSGAWYISFRKVETILEFFSNVSLKRRKKKQIRK